jgi:phage terminase small subunit
MAREGLTIKQEKYAQGLFTGLSQREAYKQAYNCENMTDKSIDECACVLAADLKVMSRIEELTEQLRIRNTLTVEWVLSNLKEVTQRCLVQEPVMIRKGNEMVESGEYTFQANGANKSLELIGKHLGMFVDKVEHTGKDGGPIEVSNLTDAEIEAKLAEMGYKKG